MLDFGIAKLQGPDPRTTLHQTRVDQRLGTPLYMSPEQLRGEPVDGRSDLFAFGILLYELLTRRHPFTRRGDLAALSTWTAVLNEPPLPFEAEEIDRLPSGLPDVIARCLEKEPGRRWSSAEDLEAAIQTIHSGGPPPIRLASPHEAVDVVAVPRGRSRGGVLAHADPGLAGAALDRAHGGPHRQRDARPGCPHPRARA